MLRSAIKYTEVICGSLRGPTALVAALAFYCGGINISNVVNRGILGGLPLSPEYNGLLLVGKVCEGLWSSFGLGLWT